MQYPDWSRFLLESQSFETYEPGILIDSSFKGSLSLPQQAELELRENVGADLDRTEEELLKEASFHHCFPVMRGLTHDKVQEYASHPNSLIVDIGTGWGWHWIEVAKNNPDKKFLLIDFSLNNLLICRKLMPFNQFPNVLCLQADATHLPLTAGISQLTWSVQVLQHLLHAEERRLQRRIGVSHQGIPKAAEFFASQQIGKPGARTRESFACPVYAFCGSQALRVGFRREEFDGNSSHKMRPVDQKVDGASTVAPESGSNEQ